MMILSLMLLMIFCFPKDLIESRLKDFEKSDYLYEYRDYYISLDRTRALKSQNDTMSFELEKEASKYRTTINKAIERIEAAHGGINLSSCKIFGTKWKITAKVENLMVISLDKDL